MNIDLLYQRLGITANQLLEFCQNNQIIELALFGSILRDDFQPNSDVDILVTFAPKAKVSLLQFIGMEQDLESLLHRKVDLVQKSAVEKDYNSIRRRAILGNYQVLHGARSLISS